MTALEEGPSPALLYPENIPQPGPVHTNTYAIEVPVSTASTVLLLVFRISKFMKTEFKAKPVNADHLTQTAGPTDMDRAEKLRTMVREG